MPMPSSALTTTGGLFLLAVALVVVSLKRRERKKPSGPQSPILVVFATVSGRAKAYAMRMAETLAKETKRPVKLVDSSTKCEPWDELLNGEARDCVLVASTYELGRAPEKCRDVVEEQLDELVNDFRVGATALRGRRFAVLGLGSSAYDNYCTAAKKAEKQLRKLGASRVASETLDDTRDDDEIRFKTFEDRVTKAFQRDSLILTRLILEKNEKKKAKPASLNKKKIPKKKVTLAIEEEEEDSDDSDSLPSDDEDDDDDDSAMVDVEDVGSTFAFGTTEAATKEKKDMVTERQALSLKKEGYKLIGSHSAVKMCRWTKHQLRGRGGCYKHTFYGISSYQCMEATPSLACANKCVFCWRHHKNPVGREWRWKTDPPLFIVEEAVKKHVAMINEAKGIPGVLEDRWREALTVRHCALSLVGEPIMYPQINEMLNELHRRRISTFLVTNAQFPEAIETLVPVTQLYVSVDAGDEGSLIKVDRPLFSDAWDRLKRSLVLLKAKEQRTVARLTIVKGYNEDDISGYADLIALGLPTFIEIKGVTFCGKSDASDLTMESCPWHHEIVHFSEDLCKALNDKGVPTEYAVACAHKHSVSVVLARKDQLYVEGEGWYTWIDYDKFHALVEAGQPFKVQDYRAKTPAWALAGAKEDGFDPVDTRLYKKKANGKSR